MVAALPHGLRKVHDLGPRLALSGSRGQFIGRLSWSGFTVPKKMRVRKTNFLTSGIALGLVAGGLLLNSPAQSCAVFRPFRLEAIKNAAMVFRGLVVDYSPRIGA